MIAFVERSPSGIVEALQKGTMLGGANDSGRAPVPFAEEGR